MTSEAWYYSARNSLAELTAQYVDLLPEDEDFRLKARS
jgi:hypothetical protein